jgi:hypothetical protein
MIPSKVGRTTIDEANIFVYQGRTYFLYQGNPRWLTVPTLLTTAEYKVMAIVLTSGLALSNQGQNRQEFERDFVAAQRSSREAM